MTNSPLADDLLAAFTEQAELTGRALHGAAMTGEHMAAELAELRDEVHSLAGNVSRLQALVLNPDNAAHSVRVATGPDMVTQWYYPMFCRACGTHWESVSDHADCPDCKDADDVVAGPLTGSLPVGGSR